MSGVMTDAAANDGLSFEGPVSPRAHRVLLPPKSPFASLLRDRLPLYRFLCSVQSGVDGDDFTSSTSDQQDALQPFGQNLEELHVWSGS